MASPHFIGIVGGSGALGSAIARALIRDRFVTPERLWISNRSGNTSGFEEWPGTRFTTHNQELVNRLTREELYRSAEGGRLRVMA